MAPPRLPKKFRNRVQARLRSFQDIAAAQRLREVSEADTVTVVKDMLCEVFGYDKYRELCAEVRIQGAFCDLAVRIEGRTRFLIEVKTVGVALADHHVRQAVNYGVHAGVDWVVLTNACEWRIYKVIFDRPIHVDEITRFHLADLHPKARHDLERLYLLAHEGVSSGALDAYWRRQQVVNHFTVAQILMSKPLVGLIRTEMRRLFPEPVGADNISRLLIDGVLKPEVLEGCKVQEAHQRLRLADRRRRAPKAARGAGVGI